MPENPPVKEDSPETREKKPEETREKGSWSEDQKKRSYYYDDASGYEIYNPDDEETEES